MHTHYRNLLVMAALSFLAMYALRYAMVDSLANVYANINQAYIAGLMTAPMVIIGRPKASANGHDTRGVNAAMQSG